MKMTRWNEELIKDMLAQMPESKKELLKKACHRNCLLTSSYSLENLTLTVYKEGWYIEMEGCRVNFKLWAGDNDGEFVFGRKPAESRLNRLYSTFTKADNVVDFNRL